MRRKKDGKAGFETPIVDPRIAMSRSDLKLKLQNQISIFTTIKTYLEKNKHYIIFSVNVSPTGDRTAIFIQSHLSHVMVF